MAGLWTPNHKEFIFKLADREKLGTDAIRGYFTFKPKLYRGSLNANTKLSGKLEKSKYTKGYTHKIKTYHCKKHLLPMKKPKEILEEPTETYQSTLHKPVGTEIKFVPKEILELEEKGKKVSEPFAKDVQNSDPLAKYRHLKITYITVKRPPRKEETFLPSLMKKLEEKEIKDEEKNAIMNFRFELLKKLNEEFKRIENHPALPSKPPEESSSDKVPYKFDKPPDKLDKPVVKIVRNIEKNSQEKQGNESVAEGMSTARVLSNIKSKSKEEMKNVKGAFFDKKKGVIKGKKNDGEPKTDGDNKNGVGGTRKYCTNADKHEGPDNKGEIKPCSDTKYEKTDPYQLILDSRKPPFVEENENCPETQSTGSKGSDQTKGSDTSDAINCEEEGFDITKEVPKAFECASERLEEDRREHLYYRYHPSSFYDLHEYLNQKRTFAIKTNETKKESGEPQPEQNKEADTGPSKTDAEKK